MPKLVVEVLFTRELSRYAEQELRDAVLELLTSIEHLLPSHPTAVLVKVSDDGDAGRINLVDKP